MLFHEYIAREGGKEEKPLRLEIGYRRIWLSDHPQELRLVVVKGAWLGADDAADEAAASLMPEVDLACSPGLSDPLADREETIRFVKQIYQLEDIREMKYRRRQNMMILLMAALHFTAVYLDFRVKLRVTA